MGDYKKFCAHIKKFKPYRELIENKNKFSNLIRG